MSGTDKDNVKVKVTSIGSHRRPDQRANTNGNGFGLRALWNGMPRSLLARFFNVAMAGKRDLYDVFGWDRSISVQMMFEMYHRGGIAKRIVNAYPEALWGRPPGVYANTPRADRWTNRFNEIARTTKLWPVLKRADQLARLGRYSIVLVGFDRPNLEQPVRNATNVLYLQPYSEQTAVITEWETDPLNPRFGLPKMYTIYPDRGEGESRTSGSAKGAAGMVNRQSFRVHASRVIHISQGELEDDVFGTPMLGAGWNYLCDLMKVVGGSAESYWLTANRGMQVDVDKEIELDPDEAADLDAEIDEYSNQMRRVLRTRGVTVRDLGSRVADPRGPYAVLVQLLSGTYAIPQRILLGSEAGHLASTQDKGNWAEQIENERALTAEPRILTPTLECLQNSGVLPQPTADIVADWPDAYRSSPSERADMASKVSLAANNLSLMFKNFKTPVNPPGGFGGAPQGSPQRQPSAPSGAEGANQGQSGKRPIPRGSAEDPQRVPPDARTSPQAPRDSGEEPILNREEMRAILGIPTDNRTLGDDPLEMGTARRVLLRANGSRPAPGETVQLSLGID